MRVSFPFRHLPLLLIAVAVLVFLPILSTVVQADTTDNGFSLQVSPSPLIATIKPGTTSTLDLQIRNTNSQSQALKMALRSFSVNATTGQVDLGASPPADVASFVNFSDPQFTLDSGQIFTQHITIHTPVSAGFTYSFAITISQQNPPKAAKGKTAIAGSVAVFTLLSVDKPGAVRKLELSKLSISHHVYEYLPATITLTLKNSGNTLAQPKGTIFIQRQPNDAKPLASITINKDGGYILPNTSRSLTTTWNDGFPHYNTTTSNGKSEQKLSWQGGDISKLRIGRYTAKVVAVYDDGERDVPIVAEVTFWVIPWRMLLGVFVVGLFVIIGLIAVLRKSSRTVRGKSKKAPKANVSSKD